MPGAGPLRVPPGQGPRAGATMRGPMGRGDYGKYCKTRIPFYFLYSQKQSLVLLVSQVTILLLFDFFFFERLILRIGNWKFRYTFFAVHVKYNSYKAVN